jgi:N-acetylneuraminic acid mutarotase
MAATADGKIYAAGGLAYPGTAGISSGSTWWWFVNTLEVYDPASDTWQTKAPMPDYRASFSLIAVNAKIYAIGGLSINFQHLARVDEYDPTTDTWTPRASLNVARCNHAAVLASNGKIYVTGGEKKGGYLDSVEE